MRSTCVLESRPLGMRQMQREVKRNKNRGSIRVWQRGHHCAPVRRRDPSLRYFAQSLSRCTPPMCAMGVHCAAVRRPRSHAARSRVSRFDLLCLVACGKVYCSVHMLHNMDMDMDMYSDSTHSTVRPNAPGSNTKTTIRHFSLIWKPTISHQASLYPLSSQRHRLDMFLPRTTSASFGRAMCAAAHHTVGFFASKMHELVD
jgi:hypothetical protein